MLTACSAPSRNTPPAETFSTEGSTDISDDVPVPADTLPAPENASISDAKARAASYVVFDDDFLTLFGYSATEFSWYLTTLAPEEGDQEYLITSEGSLAARFTPEQVAYWDEFGDNIRFGCESRLQVINDRYRLEVLEGREETNVYVDVEIPDSDVMDIAMDVLIQNAMYQLIHGYDDYTLTLNIYNVDTGRIITTGNMADSKYL